VPATTAPDTTAPDTTAPDTSATDELATEQAYLDRARTELARMRERTAALTVQAGDRISDEVLAGALAARVRSLTDDPASTLFFGRTDHLGGERWYVGRRHVADAAGDPVVLDWRAEISRAFYRAGPGEPMGVAARRRFGVDGGRLTGYEDEVVAGAPVPDATGAPVAWSSILAHEIERPRIGPMRDIVATIQPEQDEIVRADLSTSICVQGAPGTGKTAVGLHRAAWLLYAYGERLARSGVLVVGPSEAFLEHVGAVLPALGEMTVQHTTVEQLTRSAAALPLSRLDEPVPVSMLKGDSRMATLLHRAVWGHLDPGSLEDQALVLPRGVRRWRVPGYVLADIVTELSQRGVRYSAARTLAAQRMSHAVLVQMERSGESPDDRVQDAVARSREVKAWLGAHWPVLTPAAVLARLLGDREHLAACARGILSDDEQALLAWSKTPRSARTAQWSPADQVLADEVADLLARTPSLGHVILDEAQDLSAMQLRAVGRRASTASVTVLGDVAQGTTPWASADWPTALAHLGQSTAHIEVLTRGFRVPSAVIDLAAPLLATIAAGSEPPVSVRADPGSAQVLRVQSAEDLWPQVLAQTRLLLTEPGTVGLIVADADADAAQSALRRGGLELVRLGSPSGPRSDTDHDAAAHRLQLVPATLAKGLEFDRVVVVEPATIVAAEHDRVTGLRRLYVVLTRAVSALTVVHRHDLPRELGR